MKIFAIGDFHGKFPVKLQKLVNVDASYFENMCVTKYKPGIIHRDHLDAYDLNSDKGKEYTKLLGQRLMTITGFLKGTQSQWVER